MKIQRDSKTKLPVLFSMNRGKDIDRPYDQLPVLFSMNRGKDIDRL